MHVVKVRAGASEYDALIGRGLLGRIGEEARGRVRGPRCAVVADDNTASRYADAVGESLRAAAFGPSLITLPAGEEAKSLEQLGRVCDEMAAAGLDRSSFVVALGGGVVGDVAGFAAAIYHRGIAWLQVPTTLLAQVDSSIGGKTAVNTSHGKNLLGAVHQPAVVLADADTLTTLPSREFRQGFAEIIKHAVIADPSLLDAIDAFEAADLAEIVRRNVEIKAGIVAEDERDVSGRRATLNFGHTVGHAIERAAEYGTLLHGEAVSLGIVAACSVSARVAGFSDAERERVRRSLAAAGLPTRLPDGFPRDQIMEAITTDKKFDRGEVRFVVTPSLGSAYLSADVTLDDIAAAVAEL